MRFLMPLLLFSALSLVSHTCAAQTRIHHCVDASGTPVFTDQPCASMKAAPVDADANPLAPGPPHKARHCPMDMPALKKRVATVFRQRDANALAGLMLWRGYGERGAVDSIQQWAQLMQWPFLGFAGDEPAREAAPATSSWLPPLEPVHRSTPTMPDTLTLTFDHPARPRVSFRIAHRDGCLWLEP